METHQAVQLPFDPTEIVLTGMLRGLEMAVGIFDSLPWPIKLVFVVLVCVRFFGKTSKSKKTLSRSRSR
jgi:hypothetical protein